MTTQAGDEPTTGANTIPSDIEAEMIWTSSSSPPEVTLSFQGLAEPISLWQELLALGWEVPQCPPRPGSAIEWVPDPVAGTDYTIRPWRVNEFRLREGQWTREVGATIGAATYHVLRTFDTTITGTPSHLTQLRALEQSQAPEGGPQGEPVTQLPVVFLELSDEIAAQHAESLTNWIAVVGRVKAEVRWTELAPTAGLGVSEFTELATASSGTWLLDSDIPSAGPGQATFRMIVPGASASDSKLLKVMKQLGGMVSMHDLQPAIVGGPSAVLVFGVVPAHAIDMLDSNLRLRIPTGAARTEQ